MRKEFTEGLVKLAGRDDRVVLLTGDLGYSVLEPFADAHPDRFFNVGVAEQNMVGVATGMAEAGFVPFVYSIATFASLRPYEFIRNGPALHRLPVRVVGVGAGFDYGHNGVSHYALEDVAVMRAQPGMSVVAPADPRQACAALDAMWDWPGPVYFRLGRESSPVAELQGGFEAGRLDVLSEGDDVALVALGTMARSAVAAGNLLKERGISASVAVVASVAPAPEADLTELLSRAPLAIAIESHYVTGGLGSLVAETIAAHGLDCRLIRRGVLEMPRGHTGSPAYLHEVHGLAPEGIADAASAALSLANR